MKFKRLHHLVFFAVFFLLDVNAAFISENSKSPKCLSNSSVTGCVSLRGMRSFPSCFRPQSAFQHESANHPLFRPLSSTNNDDGEKTENIATSIEEELENLQQMLTYIEALEARNESQIESFIDEEDQWNSMEEDERELLKNKENIVKKLDVLTTELMQMWMGAKSMDG
eukprot:186509_1